MHLQLSVRWELIAACFGISEGFFVLDQAHIMVKFCIHLLIVGCSAVKAAKVTVIAAPRMSYVMINMQNFSALAVINTDNLLSASLFLPPQSASVYSADLRYDAVKVVFSRTKISCRTPLNKTPNSCHD